MITESALLTDQYELVMAQGYWRLGMAEQEAVFYLSYRSNPFEGDYVIACGLAEVIKYLSHYAFQNLTLPTCKDCTRQKASPFLHLNFCSIYQN